MTETNQLFSFRGKDGSVRSAYLVATGPKFSKLIWLDDRKPGIRINKVPNEDMRHATPLLYHGKPYPLTRFKRLFRKAAMRHGITKSARKELRA